MTRPSRDARVRINDDPSAWGSEATPQEAFDLAQIMCFEVMKWGRTVDIDIYASVDTNAGYRVNATPEEAGDEILAWMDGPGMELTLERYAAGDRYTVRT